MTSDMSLPHVHECQECGAILREGCERGCLYPDGWTCYLCTEAEERRQYRAWRNDSGV